jgi:hypothetical protein
MQFKEHFYRRSKGHSHGHFVVIVKSILGCIFEGTFVGILNGIWHWFQVHFGIHLNGHFNGKRH